MLLRHPLTPPVLYTAPTYIGPLWAGFSPTQITIINQSTTIISTFTLYDPRNGKTFPRTAGMHGHDGPHSAASPTTRQPQQTTPTATATGTAPTQTSPPATPAENPSVSLSPDPVMQGDTVTLNASGFTPGASLQITVNRSDGVVEHYPLSAGSDGTGTYSFSNAAGNALGRGLKDEPASKALVGGDAHGRSGMAWATAARCVGAG